MIASRRPTRQFKTFDNERTNFLIEVSVGPRRAWPHCSFHAQSLPIWLLQQDPLSLLLTSPNQMSFRFLNVIGFSTAVRGPPSNLATTKAVRLSTLLTAGLPTERASG